MVFRNFGRAAPQNLSLLLIKIMNDKGRYHAPALQDLDQALRIRPDYLHALMEFRRAIPVA